jgi:hypothetical protein
MPGPRTVNNYMMELGLSSSDSDDDQNFQPLGCCTTQSCAATQRLLATAKEIKRNSIKKAIGPARRSQYLLDYSRDGADRDGAGTKNHNGNTGKNHSGAGRKDHNGAGTKNHNDSDTVDLRRVFEGFSSRQKTVLLNYLSLESMQRADFFASTAMACVVSHGFDGNFKLFSGVRCASTGARFIVDIPRIQDTTLPHWNPNI